MKDEFHYSPNLTHKKHSEYNKVWKQEFKGFWCKHM